MSWLLLASRLWLGSPAPSTAAEAETPTGQISVSILHPGSQTLLPCRIHLQDAQGRPVRIAPHPFFRDHFVCPGRFDFKGPPGGYRYAIERGPEHERLTGVFELNAGSNPPLQLSLRRVIDLPGEGWWPGDLHVHRPPGEIELLMQAEDLYIAPVITWWNNSNAWLDRPLPSEAPVRFDGNRFHQLLAGEDEREGGALLFFHLSRPLNIRGALREHPSPVEFLTQAKTFPQAWVDIEKPFWWDMPVWIATGLTDSIGIANNHMCRSQMFESEAWGKPRDLSRLPNPRGNGFWTQEIYYQLLNCGLRIPPSAGSASGVLPNPVGYNRVYVFTGPKLDPAEWWQGLKSGRSFVSNGPLLRCEANGQKPGHVFHLPAAAPSGLSITLTAELTSLDPISHIEIVQNGEVVRRVPYIEWERTRNLGSLRFQESGWFLVPAIADVPHTFRFASTAPLYAQTADGQPRVSRAAAQFFLDWVRERQGRVLLDDPEKRQEVLKHHQAAERFWLALRNQANAD